MRNRKGQFFAFYLVFITLFMCGVVIGAYMIQNDRLQASLVSPFVVLEARDNLGVFEMKEGVLIDDCFRDADSHWVFGTDEFLDEFRSCFVRGVLADKSMVDFISGDLVLNGAPLVVADRENFVRDGVYPFGESKFIDGKLLFYRADVEKKRLLLAEDRGDVDFPVDFNFRFGRTYLIDENGEMEEVKNGLRRE